MDVCAHAGLTHLTPPQEGPLGVTLSEGANENFCVCSKVAPGKLASRKGVIEGSSVMAINGVQVKTYDQVTKGFEHGQFHTKPSLTFLSTCLVNLSLSISGKTSRWHNPETTTEKGGSCSTPFCLMHSAMNFPCEGTLHALYSIGIGLQATKGIQLH